MEMKELKPHFDEILKESYLKKGVFYMADFPYSEKYPLYFKRFILTNLMKLMSSSTKKAYKEGAGKELEEKDGIPPKFLSVGSSSRFCFVALNINEYINPKQGADFFAEEGDQLKRVTFEKQLPILDDSNVIPSHMDAYAKGEKMEYFFECKCHEMFDEHPIVLSKKYFATSRDLIVDYIPKQFLKEKDGRYEIDPSLFGLVNPVFDIKELFTHLMGIKCNQIKPKSSLIYYYCFPPKEAIDNDEILNICNRVLSEAKIIFASPIIKDYCDKNGIELRLYIFKEGPDDLAASTDNTIRVI